MYNTFTYTVGFTFSLFQCANEQLYVRFAGTYCRSNPNDTAQGELERLAITVVESTRCYIANVSVANVIYVAVI